MGLLFSMLQKRTWRGRGIKHLNIVAQPASGDTHTVLLGAMTPALLPWLGWGLVVSLKTFVKKMQMCKGSYLGPCAFLLT